jgi:hypothetical protein
LFSQVFCAAPAGLITSWRTLPRACALGSAMSPLQGSFRALQGRNRTAQGASPGL